MHESKLTRGDTRDCGGGMVAQKVDHQGVLASWLTVMTVTGLEGGVTVSSPSPSSAVASAQHRPALSGCGMRLCEKVRR